MHPLHDYLAGQLGERLRKRRVVVWYDHREEFRPFIEELRESADVSGETVTIAGSRARLAEFKGSYFALRMAVEPFVAADRPEELLIYVPGQGRDRRGSLLMELEKAGECYEPQLKRLALNVLRGRYTDGVIDEILAPERIGYRDLARAALDDGSAEPPSLLKAIFHEHARGTEEILAHWLAFDAFDAEIEAKEAGAELVKLIRARLGLELAVDASPSKLRAVTLRYVLTAEFRMDLSADPPTALDAVALPPTKDHGAAVLALARRLREAFPDHYAALADRVEAELGLAHVPLDPATLGAIDTFRFEERALLGHAADLTADGAFDAALGIVRDRERSFWLDRDVARKAQWEAIRRMSDLGAAAEAVRGELAAARNGVASWVDAYARQDGWRRLDLAQRRLEAWVATLDEDPAERPLAKVRHAYDEVCSAMTRGFVQALAKADWTIPSALHQTQVYSEIVAEQPEPVAYLLVDAMRFEMGVELEERLRATDRAAEVALRPAVAALPSITPVGMAALMPGAAASFSVDARNGRLGAVIDDAFLPDLGARRKHAAARIPGLVDLTLDDVLVLTPSKLAARLDGARLVLVRSQEIDQAGEAGFAIQARQAMDAVIDNLARALRRLAAAGVSRSVVTADHGHLFFAADRDESMRADAPGGDQVELHRRCWIGRGGATPSGCVRVSASALGYASDLEFVFPTGCGVFKAGGDLAYHHGGPSLQELLVPVLTVRLKPPDAKRAAAEPISVTGLPQVVTNRIFSITVELDPGKPSLFAGGRPIRPLLVSKGKQVGAAGMAIGADFDRAAGTIVLEPGKPVTIALLLSDDSASSLRIVFQDPATDAELYRSPTDIPVRLGV